MTFQLPATTNRTVAVLGGGVLGRRIACSWAASGFDVAVFDPDSEQRIATVHYCQANAVQFSDVKQRGSVEAFQDVQDAVSRAWLVIEAIPERLALKISTFQQLEVMAPKDAILATNSSSFKSREMVSDLQPSTKQRVLNMHYYMPPRNRVVELMTDGNTDKTIFPFLQRKLGETGMRAYVARKESTGLIFNRLWAAIKREILTILAEGVSVPEEIDELWQQIWVENVSGPVAMMDAVGLDTVSFIEQHYIAERQLSDLPVRYLQQYIDEGKLGAKSSKGGLLPAGKTTKTSAKLRGDHDNLHAPLLYFLDIGLRAPDIQDAFSSGRILTGASDGRAMRVLVDHQRTPDGLAVSLAVGKLFWTSMGVPAENDGAVLSANLDGSDVQEIVPRGHVHTPKQICIDHESKTLYFCDREGLRVMRCGFDGSGLETIIRTGRWKEDVDAVEDQTNWCVGIAVDLAQRNFYWTQKGPSKGNMGRILRASLDMPAGQTCDSRSDIEVLFRGLPEPVDLELDPAERVLYWTDRGEHPVGNSINSASLSGIQPVRAENSVPGVHYKILARNFHEAIGIKLDTRNRHIYATDLGGSVYRFDLNGGDRQRFYEEQGAFTGLTLAFV
ncbi:hypothetical protein VHEMI09062 [[Torrubiella] hemipterigena]|uniref:3-hydroxyacyl-CoA dehydrogenase n=1 Tax=[Torrubiella] hemipterigena TaxID=1531966 RepID=A0A0A1TPM1_9HYPO|nr:hypothetical protein VHEMI09062 [[Torrubiella] hemipterigena]